MLNACSENFPIEAFIRNGAPFSEEDGLACVFILLTIVV